MIVGRSKEKRKKVRDKGNASGKPKPALGSILGYPGAFRRLLNLLLIYAAIRRLREQMGAKENP